MQNELSDFTRSWGKQIVREHAAICWQYSLKLTKPVVEIVEASSYLGKWLSGTGTIMIANSLILSQPWDVVLEVLKHEMAHQLVSEQLGGKPGHGREFQRACEIMGVAPQYRKATSNLPRDLGKGQPPTMAADRLILNKVRKLLALGDSANEHEALTAMQKARQLMAKHKLEASVARETPVCSSQLINLYRKRLESYHRALCSLLIEHFQVETVITCLYDARALTSYKCIDIMGRTDSVRVAEYVYHFLTERLTVLWRRHKPLGRGSRMARNSYWLGVVNGFREGLENQERKAPEEKPNPPATGIRNLAIASNDLAVQSYVTDRYPRLRNGRRRPIRLDSLSFEAGHQAGLLLKVSKGIVAGDEEYRKPLRLPLPGPV